MLFASIKEPGRKEVGEQGRGGWGVGLESGQSEKAALLGEF